MDYLQHQIDEREDVQKKTFCKWINSILAKGGGALSPKSKNELFVRDLFTDLRDGTKLLALLEVLTTKEYKRERGKMRVHHLQNVGRALKVLEEQNVRLVNIKSSEIVDGNAKITLGLAWSLFLHWQVSDIMKELMSRTHQTNLEKALLSWCQTNTKPYPGVDIKNFTTSWSDGLAFAALLHRFRPDIIDFAKVTIMKDINERLETSFTAAKEYLGIERLLDLEDVNCNIPDKKSLMMYVMILFTALAPLSKEDEDEEASAAAKSPEMLTRQQLEEQIKLIDEQSKTNIELESYEKIVEQVLHWLLLAEDRLDQMENISGDLATVKIQFQSHEKFLLNLTEHQGDVGEVLKEGTRLLQILSDDSQTEQVRSQMKLLNGKWEDLRLRAMDRQSEIHEKLMQLQLKELDLLKDFLKQTEDRISNMSNLDDNNKKEDKSLEWLIQEQEKLQKDIFQQQTRVVDFSNLVLVIEDDKSGNISSISDGSSHYSELEDQLNALGERWSHICEWTEKRGIFLKKINLMDSNFILKLNNLCDWIGSLELKLKAIESDPGLLVREINLDVHDTSNAKFHQEIQKFLADLEKELNLKEKDIEEMDKKLSRLVDNEKTLMDDSLYNEMANSIENLTDRLEALKIMFSAIQQRIRSAPITSKTQPLPSPIEIVDILGLSMLAATSAQQTQPKPISNVNETFNNRFFDRIKEDKSLDPVESKKPKLMKPENDKNSRKLEELKEKAKDYTEKEVDDWLGRTESLFPIFESEDNSMQDQDFMSSTFGFDELDPAEQLILLDDLFVEYQDICFGLATLGEAEKERIQKIGTLLNEKKLQIDQTLIERKVDQLVNQLNLENHSNWVKETFDKISKIVPINTKELNRLKESIKMRTKIFKSPLFTKVIQEIEEENQNFLQNHQEGNGKIENILKEIQTLDESFDNLFKGVDDRIEMKDQDKLKVSNELVQDLIKSFEDDPLLKKLESNECKSAESLDLEKDFSDLVNLLSSLDSLRGNVHLIEEYQKNLGLSPADDKSAVKKFEKTYGRIQSKVSFLNEIQEKEKRWELEMDGITEWLREVDIFNMDAPVFGNLDLLEGQLDQSNALLTDIQTLREKKDHLLNFLEESKDNPKERIYLLHKKNTIESKISELVAYWNKTISEAEEKNAKLKKCYEDTKTILYSLENHKEFMNLLTREMPTESILNMDKLENPSDLAKLSRKFNLLKEKIDSRSESFKKLNDMGAQFLAEGDDNPALKDLALKFSQINSKWNEITFNIEEKAEFYKEAQRLYGEFRSKMAQEMANLDKLERKLKKTLVSCDMEELSEDLDETETYIGSSLDTSTSSKMMEKLKDIGGKLIDDKILAKTLETDLEFIDKRWKILQTQALERREKLQSELTKLMDFEEQIRLLHESFDNFAAYVDSTDSNIEKANKFILEEIVIEENELNDDARFEELRRDLEDKEAAINQLKEKIEQIVQVPEDQMELGEDQEEQESVLRIKEQLAAVQKRHKDLLKRADNLVVNKKISKEFLEMSKSDLNLNSRIESIWRKLRQTEQNLCFLELVNYDPESISNQLINCNREYNILSELKKEVESVLKEGRKKRGAQGKDKELQTFEKKLNSELDSIKFLYNKLGLQIANIRSSLEKGLNLSIDIKSDTEQIQQWNNCNISELKNDEELLFTYLEQIPRMNQILKNLVSEYDQFTKLVDKCLIEELTSLRFELEKNFMEKSKEISNLVKNFEKSSMNQATLQSKRSELDEWISTTESSIDLINDFTELKSLEDQMEEFNLKYFDLKKAYLIRIVLKGDISSFENPENLIMNDFSRRIEFIQEQIKNMNNFTLDSSAGITKQASGEIAFGIVNEAFDFFDDEADADPDEEIIQDKSQVVDKDENSRDEEMMMEGDEEIDEKTITESTVIENSSTNKNVKILEIKSHDIVQGILSIEPSIPISSNASKSPSSKSPNPNEGRKLSEIQRGSSGGDSHRSSGKYRTAQITSQSNKILTTANKEEVGGKPSKQLDIGELIASCNELNELINESNKIADDVVRERHFEDIEEKIKSLEPDIASKLSETTSLAMRMKGTDVDHRQLNELHKNWTHVKSFYSTEVHKIKSRTKMDNWFKQANKAQEHQVSQKPIGKTKLVMLSTTHGKENQLKEWINSAILKLNESSELNLSDESTLKFHISDLKNLENLLPRKKHELFENLNFKNMDESEKRTYQDQIETLRKQIPITRSQLEAKYNKLRKLTNTLEIQSGYLLELRAQLASSKHRINLNEKLAIQKNVKEKLNFSKEIELFELMNELKNLFHSSKSDLVPIQAIDEKIRQLKEDFVFVKCAVGSGMGTDSIKRNQNQPDEDIFDSLLANYLKKKATTEADSSFESGGEREDSFDSENNRIGIVKNINISKLEDLIDEMTLNLKSIKQQTVTIGDVDNIRAVLEKQRTIIRELELKKPQLDELLLTAESLKSEVTRAQLQLKVAKLKEHWAETNSSVLARLKLLEDSLHDSLAFDARFKEIQQVLTEREEEKNKILSHDESIRKQRQYEKLVADFEKICNDCITNFPKEDLSRVKNSLEFIKFNHMSSTLQHQQQQTQNQEMKISAEEKILEIRELIEWVISKETELKTLMIMNLNSMNHHNDFNFNSIQRRIEEHNNFKRSIESKRYLIERNLDLLLTNVNENISRELIKLNEMWKSVLIKSNEFDLRLDESFQKIRTLDSMLNDAQARLATTEAIISRFSEISKLHSDKSSVLDQLKTFREHISSTSRSINEINDFYREISNGGNAKLMRLNELNKRLHDLQLNIQEKEQELDVFTKNECALGPNWERAINQATGGVPYYINHSTETTQWDHPQMTEILNSLSEFNEVKFSAYRTALKIRCIQKEIRFDTLQLKTVVDTFVRLGLKKEQNDRLLDIQDMKMNLNGLYKSDPITELALNYLLNVYDSQRTGNMRSLSFKVGIILLSRGPMEEKFRYLFGLVAENKQVDQRKLGLLIHDCMQIPRQLGEIAAFGGSNIEPSVRSCFEKAGKSLNYIQIDQFLQWVKKEPQSLVWLPVLHRIAAAEKATHAAKCNVCKSVPIVGLRYRCLKCFNFDMCQVCFFSGKKRKNHKLTHPMQEYVEESTSSEDVRDFTRALKNRFKSRKSLLKSRKLGYLPVQTVLEGDLLESPMPSPQHSMSPDTLRLALGGNNLDNLSNRLRSNSTPESEDEHSLIAQYCQSLSMGPDGIQMMNTKSPLQIIASIESDQSDQLSNVIYALEQENSSLQMEYERLRQYVGPQSGGVDSNNKSLNHKSDEARMLRSHKGVLEARMQILEDHNSQLETQLAKLRLLLDTGETNGVQGSNSFEGTPYHHQQQQQQYRHPHQLNYIGNGKHHQNIVGGGMQPGSTGTLQSKSVVAADLDSNLPVNGKEIDDYIQKPPPPPSMHYNNNNTTASSASVEMLNLQSAAIDIGNSLGELVNQLTDDERD